jgi:DNA replication initiation complex subunit (GINS family)
MEQPVFTGKTIDELGDMVERTEKHVTMTAYDLVRLTEQGSNDDPVEFVSHRTGKVLNIAEYGAQGGKLRFALED